MSMVLVAVEFLCRKVQCETMHWRQAQSPATPRARILTHSPHSKGTGTLGSIIEANEAPPKLDGVVQTLEQDPSKRRSAYRPLAL
jgi:hypothetical protein